MQYNNIIITQNPAIKTALQPFLKKLKIQYIRFDEIDQILSSHSENFAKLIFYLNDQVLKEKHKEIREKLQYNPNILALFIVDASTEVDLSKETSLDKDLLYTNIPSSAPDIFLARNVANAFSYLQLQIESFELKYKVNLSANHISKLTKIGISLSNERDFTKLLRDILYSAREIAQADGGSVYLVDKDNKGNPINLRFKVSAMDLNSTEFIMPINKESIAGYVAATGKQLNIQDAYHLPPGVEYRFNKEYDKIKNYHTKSMLTVPMKNHRDEVIGVIQLINRKKNFQQKLTTEQLKTETLPFDKYSEELVMSVAGQATVSIENNYLIRDIETLFEGFVKASVSAIESRDPTTSGHSFRVAEYTVGLAQVVDKMQQGRFSSLRFSREQMKEIRYASLLHDFGKVGVREKVLVKAKKLESYELDLIKWRFCYARKEIENRIAEKKINYLKQNSTNGFAEFEKNMEYEQQQELEKLEHYLQTIISSNEPSILEQSHSKLLLDISQTEFSLLNGEKMSLISPEELRYLSIKKGSLDFEERREIESHVSHTYKFLSQIPWTTDLKMVTEIAHAHHEKLDGSGYPLGLNSEDIPIQSKMMTIADIFDALTDKDRPYKKAVPLQRALDILKMEVQDNHIDNDLLNIFIEAKIYDCMKGRIS